MLGALVEVVSQRGVSDFTIGDVVARSGVSRRTFYEVFQDREDCFLAAFDDGVFKAASVVVGACAGQDGWRDRMRLGLTALLEFFEEEPFLARLLLIESLGAGPRVLEHRRRVIQALIGVVHEGQRESTSSLRTSRLTAEAAVGGVLAVLQSRLQMSKPGLLLETLGSLMSILVLPYFGSDVAQVELDRALPTKRLSAREDHRDPLRDLPVRLTYRTVSVLRTVADQPGLSNRQVADGAGISDPGQISKLLARLESSGLLTNSGGAGSRQRGIPNAWALTRRGRAVQSAIYRSSLGYHHSADEFSRSTRGADQTVDAARAVLQAAIAS